MEAEQVQERTDVEKGQIVMPFYVICDISYSMAGDMPALNSALQDLRDAIKNEPAVDDVARLSVITFSDNAQVATPLGQVSETTMPDLSAQSGTNYGAAFRLLAQTLSDDRKRLKADGYRSYRPCAFFLTDGEPQDQDYGQTFVDTLTYDPASGKGLKAHPIFVPFGFRDAPEEILTRLAFPPDKSRWYRATATGAEALTGLLGIIMRTVVTSSRRASKGERDAVQLADASSDANLKSGDSNYDPDFW